MPTYEAYDELSHDMAGTEATLRMPFGKTTIDQ